MPALARSPLEEIVDAGGLGLVVINLDEQSAAIPRAEDGVICLGIHRRGPAPTEGLERYDILLSADPAAPAPWVGLSAERLEADLARLADVIEQQPVAAAVVAQVLRMTLKLSFDEALVLESLGYSTLLASEGFRAWRAATPARQRPDDPGPRVLLSRDREGLSIRLSRPGSRNAVDARMRDALVEALDFALADPDAAPVVLSGEGPAFSAGGDLDEFGLADDAGRSHAIRVLRHSARLAHRLGPRLTARLHGACMGAGIEVSAAAHKVIARPDALFRLPEVSMGLLPGAGGTASVPRRIGRQRACYMAISGRDIDVGTALAWGLVDDLDGRP